MPIKTKTTNITGAFAKLNLLLRIRNILFLKSESRAESLLGFSILNAIDKKQPADEILKMIQECRRDNDRIVTELIGEELTIEVMTIKL